VERVLLTPPAEKKKVGSGANLKVLKFDVSGGKNRKKRPGSFGTKERDVAWCGTNVQRGSEGLHRRDSSALTKCFGKGESRGGREVWVQERTLLSNAKDGKGRSFDGVGD